LKKVGSIYLNIFKKVGGFLWGALKKVGSIYLNIFKKVGGFLWGALKKVGSIYLNIFKKVGSLIWKGLKFVGSIYLNIFKKVGSLIWKGLKFVGSIYLNVFKKVGSLIWKGLKFVGSIYLNVFKKVGSLIWKGLKFVGSIYLNVFKKVGSLIWEGLKFVGSIYLNVFKKVGSLIWEGLKSIGSRFIGIFKDFGSLIWENLKTKANFLRDPWANFRTKIQGWIDILKNPFGAISDIFAKMSNAVQSTFATIVNGLIDFASKIIPGVGKLLNKYRMEVPEKSKDGAEERIKTPEEQSERLEQLKARSDFKRENPDIAPKFIQDNVAWGDIERFTPIPEFTPATPQSIRTSQEQVAETERTADSLVPEKKDGKSTEQLLRGFLIALEANNKKPIQIQNKTSVEMDSKALGTAVATAAGRQ